MLDAAASSCMSPGQLCYRAAKAAQHIDLFLHPLSQNLDFWILVQTEQAHVQGQHFTSEPSARSALQSDERKIRSQSLILNI